MRVTTIAPNAAASAAQGGSSSSKTGPAAFLSNLLRTLIPAKESPKPEDITTTLPLSPSGAGRQHEVLRKQLTGQIEAFSRRLLESLSAAGIDLAKDFRLESDAFGGIRAGEHPQFAEIEALFEQTPELRSLYHIVAANASYLSGHENSIKDFEVTLNDGQLKLGFD